MAAERLFLLLLLAGPVLTRRYPSFRLRRRYSEQHQQQVPDVRGAVGERLILTGYLGEGRLEEARNLSRVTGGPFPEDIPSYSGFFTVNSEYDSNIFFWFFPAEHDYENAPVLLWLQGGPGSSSMFGLFTEMGPFFVANDSRTLVKNPYSWHKNHSLIFIDNPVGTGFSYTGNYLGYTKNEEDVGRDLYSAMLQFFTLFPELQDHEFFISGESYAGKYIPALGHAIHMNNPTASLQINLKGMAIGDGYVDPVNMIRYSDIVYQWGLVDNSTWRRMQEQEDSALHLVAAGEFVAANDASNEAIDIYQKASSASAYNILEASGESEESYVEFLNGASVRSALHVGNQTFMDDGVASYDHLEADIMQSVSPWVERLLDSGYRVVFYNGQLDVICGYALTVKMAEALSFGAAGEYKMAPRRTWRAHGRVAGYVKTAGNMSEVLVRSAGHMVPSDQPAAAFDLIYKVTRNQL
ncbi:venom serine carboxypeptidase-like [Bacillus rossius redtenbacheri]|uniref:venom serine carboxypeptidase-like n=1 Tax=Bacillus rossius redtenbacheri TaxID=93214 RepID=UPI002FDEC4B5